MNYVHVLVDPVVTVLVTGIVSFAAHRIAKLKWGAIVAPALVKDEPKLIKAVEADVPIK